MIMRRYLFVLGTLLMFGMFCACSNSDEDASKNGIVGCFSACVYSVNNEVDTIKASITNAPDGLSDFQPRKGFHFILLKSDFQRHNIQINDIVDFIIYQYEILPMPENGPCIWGPDYFCRIKPCK